MTASAVPSLLLGFLRDSDPEALLRWAREDGGGDWDETLAEATREGLTPWLYRSLRKALPNGELPRGLAEWLERQFFGVAARNMMLAGELAGILRAFEKRGVRCAPLRGLALAERLYGDSAVRPMGDIDLLIRKDDLSQVAAVLHDLGYRDVDRRPGFARAFSYTLELYTDRHGGLVVEPHWTIAYPPFTDQVDMERVWARCGRGRVAGVETWLLGREALLLHLCLHIAHKDGAAPLLWLHELDRLLRREGTDIDWTEFLTLAGRGTLGALTAGVLREVQALFATPIPEEVLARLTQPSRSLDGRVLRLLSRSCTADGKESLAVFLTLEGFYAKLRYALALLFPSSEFMILHYGLHRRGQLGLAYARRVCRFSWEAMKGVAALLT